MALDLFLSPLISVVVNKAADLLIKQFCQMYGMEENREKLHLKLLGIQAMVADAEKQGENNPFVEACLKKLHAAAYEAVDVLDEFQYEALRQNAIRQQPSAPAKAMKNFFSSENPILFRQKMSKKLSKTLEKIDAIVTEMNNFKFDKRDLDHNMDRETQSSIIESEVFGRDHEKEKIVNVLLHPQRERENITILPIVGMGGMGKTTLAQLVYNHERVKGCFQLLMWVCVSTEFNIVNIIKSAIQVVQKGGDVSTSNKEVLQQQLREILDKKRYLLVLDDVWEFEREKWDELKTLLFSGASSGSVIILTTRSKGVASIMGTLPSHDLASLTEEDSWRLFEKRAFGARVEPLEELITIGRAIVRKCAGLPLAVKAMGGLMGTKSDVRDWRVVAENKLLEGLGSSESILPLLKLSYDHLPSHMKQCFSFCAVFPQDYLIERDTLIQLWMANDFIPTDRTMDLEDKGRQIFNELCWRSFFQDIEEKETNYGLITTCKMHDIMHDLATNIAGMKCSTSLEMNHAEIAEKNVQHLSVLGGISPENITSVSKQFPSIHTCLVGRNYPSNQTKDKHSYLLKSSSLRALKFAFNLPPPKEFGYMRHLKYLDLSGSRFQSLPETISKLYNVQTLNLSHSQICDLPKDMRYMTNLRHIFLDGCSNLERMPIGLGQLKYLRTLTVYIADSERGGSIRELNTLNLCGHLSLSGLEKVKHREDAEAINLGAKSNLYSLELKWDSKERTGNDQEVLEALRPHSKLKFLGIEGFRGSSFPKWMKEPLVTKNIKKLRLTECMNCVELPPLWQLPLLENLYLEKMESLIYIVGGKDKYADGSETPITFPKLKVLEVDSLPNLEGWHERDCELVIFPNLNELRILYCPKLKTAPVHAPVLAKLEVLNSSEIKLHHISSLPMLSDLNIDVETPPTETDAFRPPKTLEIMRITGFENVNPLEEDENESYQANSLCQLMIYNSHCFFSCMRTKLALGFWKHFAALEDLWIYSCDGLVYWPEEEFRSLKCLKELDIDYCENFTGSLPVPSSPTPRGEDPLPQLESLTIWNCPELVEVPIRSKSLKELHIGICPKLSQDGLAGLTNLTELKMLDLRGCTNLRALPDNMGNLPSLEHLEISDCPGIESFPVGLQRRLPSLRYLCIWNCPVLERRCRGEGDYRHLVSSIPQTEFSPEEEEEAEEISKSESILRRLLPICGRS